MNALGTYCSWLGQLFRNDDLYGSSDQRFSSRNFLRIVSSTGFRYLKSKVWRI